MQFSNFRTLPIELIAYIIEHLPASDFLKHPNNTCRTFRSIITDFPRLAAVSQSYGVYVIGGINSSRKYYTTPGLCPCNELRPMIRYDGTSWSHSAPMTAGRYHCGVVVWDRQIYVVGGRDSKKRLSSVERYCIYEKKWMNLPEMVTVRSAPACVAMSGIVYVFGGYDGVHEHSTVERFHIRDGVWLNSSEFPVMPFAACELSAAVIGKRIYVVGGTQKRHEIDERVLPHVRCYDTSLGQWTIVASLNQPRMCPAVVCVPESNTLYVLGGGDGIEALRSIEYLRLSQQTQEEEEAQGFQLSQVQLRTCRANAAGTLWGGMIYVLGGFFLPEGGPLETGEAIGVRGIDGGMRPHATTTLHPMPEKRDACKVFALD